MRLKFKKLVTSNDRSGAGRKTCPYYDELNRILHKQRRVWTAELVQATPPVPARQDPRTRHTRAHPDQQPAPGQCQENREPRPSTSTQAYRPITGPQRPTTTAEGTSPQLFPVDSQDTGNAEETSSSQEGSDNQPASEDSSDDGEDGDDGATGAWPAHQHETEDEEGEAEEEEQEQEEKREEEPVEVAQQDPEHKLRYRLPPDVNMEDLMSGERAALITARRRCISALQRVADNLADQDAEESRAAERAEQRRHQEVLEELRAGRARDGVDREDRQAMRRAMETSSAAIVDLTRAVSLLVDTIQLQGHQQPQVGPIPQPAQDIRSGATPGAREPPAGNTVHGPLGMGAPVAEAGPQGGTATGACPGDPERQGAVPAGTGAATPKHGRPSTAPTPGGGPETR
ncbi:UNVERIFIED_CONTAM: hypothetical protein K2H54_053892 [Gekko kuhli]